MHPDDLPLLPTSSGVYLFKKGKSTLYIGKANNLRARVQQHFKSDGKSRKFTALADTLDFLTTSNEVEALILEANLIKQYRPHYNVLLKDDKHYPFLKLTAEEFPMLIVTRRVLKDGAHYYGPYPDRAAVQRVKKLIDATFPLRKNSGLPMKPKPRTCLNYHMQRCLGPCVDANIDEQSRQQYQNAVGQIKALLDGNIQPTLEHLTAAMQTAAKRQDFEQAAKLRDRLQAIQKLFEYEQHAFKHDNTNLDFLGVAQSGRFAMVQLFRMRSGKIIGRDKRFLHIPDSDQTNDPNNNTDHDQDEILEAFIKDYYTQTTQVPPLILLPTELPEKQLWQTFLSEKAKRKVELRKPKQGDKTELLLMAERNATAGLEAELALLERRGDHPILEAVREVLALPARPWRIEGYDNSNLFGSHIVSGMVVFEGGQAKRGQYRRFKVKELENPDDYASMHQTILRRFTGRLSDKLPLPDLLLIDGGRGQVSAALAALKEAKVQIPLVGLAKREERLILPSHYGAQWWLTTGNQIGQNREILLTTTHPALRLLIGVRDEVHRYAVNYHRKLRDQHMLRSVFDDIQGIGPKRRQALLEHFTSLEEIAAATTEQIAALPEMNRSAANAVKTFLTQQIKQQTEQQASQAKTD